MDQLVFEILGNESMMATTSHHDISTTSNGQNNFNFDIFQNSMDYEEMNTNKKVENILAEMVGTNNKGNHINNNNNSNNESNIPPLDSQQQLHNLLAKVLTRKLSWDTTSSHEDINKESIAQQPIIPEIKEILINDINHKDNIEDKEPIEYLGQSNGISILEKNVLSAPVSFFIRKISETKNIFT